MCRLLSQGACLSVIEKQHGKSIKVFTTANVGDGSNDHGSTIHEVQPELAIYSKTTSGRFSVNQVTKERYINVQITGFIETCRNPTLTRM